jgi:hypothetical protein
MAKTVAAFALGEESLDIPRNATFPPLARHHSQWHSLSLCQRRQFLSKLSDLEFTEYTPRDLLVCL